MDKLINLEKFNIKQIAAIEIRARHFTISTKELAIQVGVTDDTIRKWFRNKDIMEACIKRHEEYDDEKAHILMESLYREGELGNATASEKWFKVKGYLDRVININHRMAAPFDQHLARNDNNQIEEAEIVNDDINVNVIPLPPRDPKNDDPKKVVRDENKKIKQSYARQKLNTDQMGRHFWRKRARAVGIDMLPPGRPSKDRLMKWQNDIVEAERVFANGILPNKQKSPD